MYSREPGSRGDLTVCMCGWNCSPTSGLSDAMLNPAADTSASEQLKKIVAMSAALKMDGALIGTRCISSNRPWHGHAAGQGCAEAFVHG